MIYRLSFCFVKPPGQSGGFHKTKITVDKKASTVKENAPPVVVQTPTEKIEDNQPSANDNQSQVVYRTRTGRNYAK